jgi:carboxyl-terminal processing protease
MPSAVHGYRSAVAREGAVMSKRTKITIISLIIIALMITSFAAGCSVVTRLVGQDVSGINVIRQAWNIIHSDYVDKSKLDDPAMTSAAIQSMLDSVDDPYSVYMTPSEYKIGSSDINGSFEGIGAGVGINALNQIVIVNPKPGSPAEKAGIQSGDIILAIDGKSTEGMTLDTAVGLTRGPAGTPVTLLVQHPDGSAPVSISITRAKITTTTVTFEMKGDIAYIKISEFTLTTDDELSTVIKSLTDSGAKGIVLDLRDNPGGILDTVVKVIGRFVKSGDAVTTVDNAGKKETISIKAADNMTDLPMVVLVNGKSASGSEVLSGALQDYSRAVVAGTTTFGKGSVDQLFRLQDGSGIYLTTGRWLTPKGRLIEGKGITPDINVNFTGDEQVQWAVDFLHGKN